MRRQKEILNWAEDTFGRIALRNGERAMRFLEEAVELAHSVDLERDTVERIINRVYARPRGELQRELGQAGMTLEALAEVFGCSLDSEISLEFERVRKIPKAEFAKRHAVKVELGIATANPPRMMKHNYTALWPMEQHHGRHEYRAGCDELGCAAEPDGAECSRDTSLGEPSEKEREK